MKIMKIAALAVALLSPLVLSGCYERVEAGNVGVKVQLLGTDKGVDAEELGPGRYWIGWNEDLFTFPTFTQNDIWEGDQTLHFQDRDGLQASADVGISYAIDPDKATDIFQKYRKGIEEITDMYVRNMVRDALVRQASKRPLEYLYGPGKGDLMDAVQADVSKQVEPIGLKIEKIYWVGEIVFPKEVKDKINAKIGAAQETARIEEEVKQRKAEADKKIEDARGQAESIKKVATAQAEANKLLNDSLTPALLQYKALEEWDGILPKIMGSGATPLVNVDELVKTAN